jgi:hypothetical protein
MKKELSLLEKAKLVKSSKKNYTEQEIELALAWVDGSISLTQIVKVFQLKSVTAGYIFIANCLKYYIKNSKK